MKRNVRTIFFVLIAVCTVLAVLTACSSGASDESDSPDESSSLVDTVQETEDSAVLNTGNSEDNDEKVEIEYSASETESSSEDETEQLSIEEVSELLGIQVNLPEITDEEKQAKVDRIEELLNQLYGMESSYIDQLESLEGQATGEYRALPSEEKTDEKQSEIAMKYYDLALGLESQCDIEVDSICAEMQLLLNQINSTDDLVSRIRTQYNNEKNEIMDEYLSIYGSYLS